MDIVMLDRQGLSKRQIAKRLGIHRGTVSRYLERGGQPPPPPASRRGSVLGAFADRIKAWMEEDDYHATWMHQRLKVLGFEGGLRAVQRFVRGVRDRLVRKAFLRFETEPGQQAQVDFAELAVVDEGGETVAKYHMFLMVLGFSRKRYAELLLRPDLTNFMEAHQRAFRFFGGVPAEILYDCMKTGVIRRRGQEPPGKQVFLSFAEHTGFAPRLCPPYASWVKGYASYCTSSVGIGGSFPSPCGGDAPHELPVVSVLDRAGLSRWFEEVLSLVVVRVGAQKTRTPPPLDAVGTDPEPPGDLPRVQHAGGTKPIVATLQIVLRADVADSPWLEGLPCA